MTNQIFDDLEANHMTQSYWHDVIENLIGYRVQVHLMFALYKEMHGQYVDEVAIAPSSLMPMDRKL